MEDLTILHLRCGPGAAVVVDAWLLVDEGLSEVELEESVNFGDTGTMVAGLRHAQPLEILDARDLQPFAMTLGVGIGTPAW